MPKGTISCLALLVLAFSQFSCGKNVVYTDTRTMSGRKWELADVPVFQIPVKDTLSNNNILFTIRTGTAYPFRNIYLFVTTTSPDGKNITDTLEYYLADEKGKWYGKGFGDIHELSLPYKANVFFPLSGIYQLKVQHGMRTEELKGVYDFGVKIEKVTD